MSVGETTTKCVMAVFAALLVFFVLLATSQLETIKKNRTAYETSITVVQQNLANVRQTLTTQNEQVKSILLQLSRAQSMEDVDVVLKSIGIERVETGKKTR